MAPDFNLCVDLGTPTLKIVGNIAFRFPLAIDAHRRQCELHLRHLRFTSSAEIEVAQNLGHLVAAPRRRRTVSEEECVRQCLQFHHEI